MAEQPKPLMPSATASWLVENTSLSFRQIADFCGLHALEVQAIADETASTKLTGRDPVRAGELTHEEIEKGQADENYDLKMHKAPDPMTRTKGPRYTPVSKRQDKPDGIAWIIKNHPEVSDGQISKLIGTTRNTISNIRDRTHWNMANIQPKDPVTLGLTTQRELDAAVAKAQKEAGTAEAAADPTLSHDREALIEQLRKEREQAAADAEAALKAQSGEAEDDRPEIVPGIKDPFKH
ncbi:DUF1013 domain-containing protein [Sphingomicrobium astaxanthinifaciens]|uniref:DUF1013 domain-containing protein n=1 Tax=Sphingomicrobium astaxanthinifaciens TaxID=1227949 RepID=UPI001FCAD8B5|nr:DUF1013 domain-containing protein [Sphingomicrobium astaxanthinifaciens]MCJ7420606.1 DUF1013 domain-containing protein [Sphingomicrobium astaxanthinifaciens]